MAAGQFEKGSSKGAMLKLIAKVVGTGVKAAEFVKNFY